MPQTKTNQILASLRAVVDAGGPQAPVKSHAQPKATIGPLSPWQKFTEKVLPAGDEPLAQRGVFDALMGGSPRSQSDMNKDIAQMPGELVSKLPKLPIIAPEAYEHVKAGGARLYSRLTDSFAKAPKMMNPDKVRSVAKMGASGEEISLRKLEEFLSGKQPMEKVAREDVMGHLAANPLDLDIVRKGEHRASSEGLAYNKFIHDMDTKYGPQQWNTSDGALGGRVLPQENLAVLSADEEALFNQLADANENALDRSTAASTQYDYLQTPGPKENYGETLINLPVDRSGYGTAAQAAPDFTPQGYQRRQDIQNPGVFQSTHWDEPNNLVWSRHNDRQLPDMDKPIPNDLLSDMSPEEYRLSPGKKGRFIEEIQSDWHQQGRERGYKPSPEERAAMDARIAQMEHEGIGTLPTPELDRYNDIMTRQRDGVPDAPFKDTYHELALKQQLLDAADDPSLEWLGVADAHTNAAMEGHDYTRVGTQIGYDEKNPNALRRLLEPMGGNVEHTTLPVDTSGSNKAPKFENYSVAAYPNDSKTVPQGTQRIVDYNTTPGQGTHVLDMLPARDDGPWRQLNASRAVESLSNSRTGQSAPAIDRLNASMWKANLTPELKQLIKERGFPVMTLLMLLQQMNQPHAPEQE